MADDEVRISASLQDDISAALAKIEQRLKSVEDEVSRMGREGAKGGAEFAAGMDKAGKAADKAGDQARQAKKPIKDAGDEAAKSGAKAAAGSTGLDKFAKAAERAKKKSGGFKTILTAFKFAGMISGAFALAGGISAIGAGAIIAIGALAPLVGVIGAALPFFAAAKLGMLAWKLAATQLEPSLNRIKTQFTELGPVIAKGGLQQGLDYFANSVGKLATVTGRGLAGLGGEMGTAARNAGNLAKSSPFLNQISRIFAGLRPILGFVLTGLLAIAQAVINMTEAALPAATSMASVFADVAGSLRDWTAAQLANGKVAAFVTRGWEMFRQIVGVVVDVMIGLYNVFKIGAGFIGNMGNSIHDAAWEFRQWTASAEGQQKITAYFQQSLPALQEMGKLLKFIVTGFAGLGANANVAPLLAQLNSQLLPAIMQLVQNLAGQGGLGPAVISAASSLAQLFAGLDFSGLTMFVQGVAAVLQALVWLQQNVPGANMVISVLLGTMVGFKLLGPIWGIVASGASAFAWMGTALEGTKQLSLAQKLFSGAARQVSLAFVSVGGAVVNTVLPALKGIATVGIGAIRALSVALFTTPIGWIILAIIAVIAAIWLLWTKCAWFRDAVMAVWNAIKIAAMAVWEAIKTAAIAVVDALVAAWNWVRDATIAVWNALKTAWEATVNFIVMVAMWIWDHGLKQVLSVIMGAFEVTWNIIKFIVQTAVYIIVAIVTVIAIVLKAIFDGIVAVAVWAWGLISTAASAVWNAIVAVVMWVWGTILQPIFSAIGAYFTAVWTAIQTVAMMVWNAIVAGATWFWNTILLPIITALKAAWDAIWNAMLTVANFLWVGIQTGAQMVWAFLQPIFQAIGDAGSAVWNTIKEVASAVWGAITDGWNKVWDFLSGIWDKLKGAGTGVWDAIKTAAGAVADVIKGVWDTIVGAVKGVWNFIAKGWNSIPDITVPDWIPLIGGKTFSLPKLATLWHGGEVPGGGTAIVGEHGPEPVVQNGMVTGMVGLNGPEITGIPKGGYVVPNLRTLNALPGLAKSLPAGVASAVARSVPGYAGALSSPAASGAVKPSGNGALAAQVARLAVAVADRPAPVTVNGAAGDIYAQVLAANRAIERERKLKRGYSYTAGSG